MQGIAQGAYAVGLFDGLHSGDTHVGDVQIEGAGQFHGFAVKCGLDGVMRVLNGFPRGELGRHGDVPVWQQVQRNAVAGIDALITRDDLQLGDGIHAGVADGELDVDIAVGVELLICQHHRRLLDLVGELLRGGIHSADGVGHGDGRSLIVLTVGNSHLTLCSLAVISTQDD